MASSQQLFARIVRPWLEKNCLDCHGGSKIKSDFNLSTRELLLKDGWDERQDCVSIMTLHAAKGLEFPVVYMVAVEQGLLPYERSIANREELEEERRLAFVGMTRAKEELYLSHTRSRDFRGQIVYPVESMFFRDLPAEAIEHLDMSAGNTSSAAFDEWRGGGPAAEDGWNDAGIRSRPMPIPPHTPDRSDKRGFVEGMLVRHANYGNGRIVEVSGQGALRRIKIRFAAAGERTFIADKVTLEIVDWK